MYYDVAQGAKIIHDKTGLPGPVKSMVEAVNKSTHCEIDKVAKSNGVFIVVIDIYCDDIPSRNSAGIDYHEKIAMLFNDNSGIPETLAMRKAFPRLIHQNGHYEGTPRPLCLYDADLKELEFTWTPEQHLDRLKWWLVESANGTLHHPTQSLEPLFFTPSATLLLSSELDNASANIKETLSASLIFQDDKRYVVYMTSKHDESAIKADVIHLVEPPVLHGVIYSPPRTLNELVSMMENLSNGFLDRLRNHLLAAFKSERSSQAHDLTIILISFKLCRDKGLAEEKVQHIAFGCALSMRDLFIKLEIVNPTQHSLYPNTSINGTLNPLKNAMPRIDIEPMEVQIETTAHIRRMQSGIPSNCHNGLLIGAGSLGGSLLDIWTKQGWGDWTVIDDDILKPHNTTRYPNVFHKCNYKVVSISSTLNHLYNSKIKPIIGKGDNLADDSIKQTQLDASFVIDATASLYYPRFASNENSFKRHISAFFNPNGDDAVLLAESSNRKIRLQHLEAQYYRAIINEDTLSGHLVTTLDSFSTGTSCRDKSFVMSFSHTQSLSCLLADQIRFAIEQSGAQIKIWRNDFDSGSRTSISIEAKKPLRNKFHTNNTLDVIWDEGIEEKVKHLRSQALPNETGGILVGYYDFVYKKVMIVDALPPPSDSISTPSSFVRGENGVAECLAYINKQTRDVVKYIGEWHSHPKGCSASMSTQDKTQLKQLSERQSIIGYPAYQMIVAENEIKVYEQLAD